MTFIIDQRKPEGVTVLNLNGRMVQGKESMRLEKTLQDLAAGGERKILLNLGGVTTMDAAGLGTLVRSYRALMQQNGQMKLLSVPVPIQTRLRITRLNNLFETFDEEARAVQSFS